MVASWSYVQSSARVKLTLPSNDELEWRGREISKSVMTPRVKGAVMSPNWLGLHFIMGTF
jgi:hypothetical protein